MALVRRDGFTIISESADNITSFSVNQTTVSGSDLTIELQIGTEYKEEIDNQPTGVRMGMQQPTSRDAAWSLKQHVSSDATSRPTSFCVNRTTMSGSDLTIELQINTD
jgi:hypothetical protein